MEKIIENLKPRVGNVYSYGWQIMKIYFLPLFLLLLITGVVGLPVGFINDRPMFVFKHAHEMDGWNDVMKNQQFFNSAGTVLLKIFALLYTLFIINPIGYGARYVRLKAVRKENFDVKEVFDVFKNYLNVVLAALLASSIIVIGFIFLIIPGIIFACRLAFVPYLVMDKKLDPVKAVEESWRLTKGYGWKILLMAILAFFIGLAGLICLGVGIIFSFIWISAAFAAMYHAVNQEKSVVYVIHSQNEQEENE
jgi:uncharacterized membrane protein